MAYCIYVIRSKSTGKRYTGYTNNIDRRLKEHNRPSSKNSLYTKRNKGPWELIYTKHFNTRIEAIKAESLLKTGKGRKLIKQTTPR